jgi:GH25 family lysozyme M1 (1,4-beta-N-acetylmuramidase)
LWIAHYGVTSPDIGWQLKRWLFWQKTDRGPGFNYGVESKQLDLDYYNGDYASLRKFCGVDVIPEPEKTIEERLTALEMWIKQHG